MKLNTRGIDVSKLPEGGQPMILEAGIGALIGAAILGTIYAAWKFLFGTQNEPVFYPRACDLAEASTLTSDPYKRAVVAQIVRALGYKPGKIDETKVPSHPIESEGEMRALLEVLGIKPPAEFGANWQSLVKEEEQRKKAMGFAVAVPVAAAPAAQDPGIIAGVVRSVEALAAQVEAISAKVLPAPVPAPAAATAPAPAPAPAPVPAPAPAKDEIPAPAPAK